MYYTVIKHDGHLRTPGNVENISCRRVFSTFLECSQMSGVRDQSECVKGPIYIIN